MVKAVHAKIGVVEGLMTTVHSYTNDQRLIDVYHPDIRRSPLRHPLNDPN